MKTILTLVLFLLPASFILGQHTYVGVASCSPCHKTDKQGNQFGIWQETKHSKAYETLKTEEANAIAKEKGFTTPAVETEACLKCHSTGYNLEASMMGDKFKVEEGVQCETCHGPGSDYKSMKIMKVHADAVANGMTEIKDVEAFCKNCHNSESPTFKEFNFAESWEKIKHAVPEK